MGHFLKSINCNMSSSTVKAKFKCNSVTDFGHQKKVDFTAVSGQKGDNADYAKYTPSGQLSITVDNGTNAADFFKPQEEYYLTFEAATPVITEA